MAQIHGIPGEWARVNGSVLGLWPFFLGVFAFGLFVALTFTGWPRTGLCGIVLSLVGIAFSFVRGLRHVERFYKGARGEERVSRILSDLSDSYHVFNDFVAGRMHIDHVVVGPAGVFVLETKCWAGRVTIEEGHILVDGRLPSRPPLVQARREAEAAEAVLRRLGWQGAVSPVLVFASDTFAQHIAEIGGTVVINSCDLASAFGTKSSILSADEIGRIAALMENNR